MPEITWYHNETRIKEGKRHKVTLTEAENKLFYLVHLEITNVEAADAGTYKVGKLTRRKYIFQMYVNLSLSFFFPVKAVAKNSTGEGQATINLTFEEGMDLGSRPKIPDGVPPRFPKKPTIRQEGDNLIMECILEANPLPDITWFRGDKVSVGKIWDKHFASYDIF